MGEETTRRASGPAPPGGPEPRELTFGEHLVAFVKELTTVVVGAIIVASLLRGFVGQMFLIPSDSMENTLVRNDRVLVEKLSRVERGQVVAFLDPGGWLAGSTSDPRGPVGRMLQFVGVLPDTSTQHLIKRVIGMPGDHVVCCDAENRLSVNEQPLDETSYLYRSADGSQTPPSSIRFDVVVPAGRVFMMGDNRADSRDSRCHLNDDQTGSVRGANAFVPIDLVVGHGLAVVWPLGRTHRLPVPATFNSVPVAEEPVPGIPEINTGPEANC